jgi:hypothetical protein
MASLTGQTISTTYDSLLKLTDNGPITASFKEITDGLGNSSGVFVKSTGQIKLGNYTTTTSFTGTAAGYLAFTSAGEIITTAIPSGGITSLNALTASTQTFAVGTSGTDFAISSATSTHTFNLPTASAANRGALSSADWTTFNNKQNALTNPVTGTGTTNYVPKFTGSTAIGNSIIFDNGTQVGIGTASPASTLDVSGSITSSSNVRALRFWGGPSVFTSHGAPLHIFSSTIGTSPIARFNNNESTDASTLTSMWLENYAGYRAELAYTTHLNGSNIYINNTYSSGNILFNIAGSEKLRIASSGNVGIGTSSPTQKLDVRGNIFTTGSSIYSDGTSNILLAGRDFDFYGVANSDGGLFVYGNNKLHLSTNAVRRLSVDGSGNVGIGTASPSSILHIQTASGTASKLYIGQAATAAWSIGNNASANTFSIIDEQFSATRLFIGSSGNVGIGTTSPSLPLHVYNSAAALAYFESTNASGAYTIWRNSGTSFGDVGSALGISGSGSASDFMVASRAGSMILGTSSAERMRITSAGNVGIGTTSPSYKLDVNGSSIFRGWSSMSAGSPFAWNSVSGLYVATGYSAAINTEIADGAMTFFTAPSGTAGASATFTERMRITSAGNVGIGTTTPLGVLHISGLGAVGQLYADQYGTAGSNLLLRSARGTQSAPTSTLSGDLLGSIGVRGYGATGFSSGGRAGLYMYAAENFTDTAQGTYLILGTALNGTASRAERMRITDAGNVGIGTTNTGGSKLCVQDSSILVRTDGDILKVNDVADTTYWFRLSRNSSDFEISNRQAGALKLLTSDVERMRITSAGNVGIGNTSPSQKLDVTGAGVFSSTVTASGFFNSSDIRLKELVDITYNPLEITPITYKWKDGSDDKNHVGYSAQQVQEHMPDAVSENQEGLLSVDYIQVLVAKVASLEKRVKEMEDK